MWVETNLLLKWILKGLDRQRELNPNHFLFGAWDSVINGNRTSCPGQESHREWLEIRAPDRDARVQFPLVMELFKYSFQWSINFCSRWKFGQWIFLAWDVCMVCVCVCPGLGLIRAQLQTCARGVSGGKLVGEFSD